MNKTIQNALDMLVQNTDTTKDRLLPDDFAAAVELFALVLKYGVNELPDPIKMQEYLQKHYHLSESLANDYIMAYEAVEAVLVNPLDTYWQPQAVQELIETSSRA